MTGVNGKIAEIADRAASSSYFRLISQVAMTLAAPTLIWTAGALWDLNNKQSALNGKLEVLQTRIESQMDNRYRATDAERDFRLRDQLIAFVKDRADQLDRRVERLEHPRP